MKYKKKPIVVEAIQWTGLNFIQVMDFVGEILEYGVDVHRSAAYLAGQGQPICYIVIPTLEGNMWAISGDYIIKGVNGEYYPCKPDIFKKTYEEVKE